jgi:hypothetical protein
MIMHGGIGALIIMNSQKHTCSRAAPNFGFSFSLFSKLQILPILDAERSVIGGYCLVQAKKGMRANALGK